MSSLCRSHLVLALGLAAISLTSARAADDTKETQKVKKDATVTFRTVDSVDLKGTLWTPTNKKNACVLLLHDFSRKTGGNRNDDGWNDLGEALAKEGYTVLSFDFRGRGDSQRSARNSGISSNTLITKHCCVARSSLRQTTTHRKSTTKRFP